MSLRRAPVTTVLLGLIALMWVVEGGLAVHSVEGTVSLHRALLLGAVARPLVVDGGWWRLVASAFIHWSWVHVISNGVSLFFVGTMVEPFYRAWRYVAIYLAGAIIGALAAIVMMPPFTVSAGASGAIFALLGALLVLAFWMRPPYRGSLLRSVGFWILLNLVFDVYNPSIAIWDHIGGLLAGILTAMAVGLPERPWSRWNTAGLVALAALVLWLVAP